MLLLWVLVLLISLLLSNHHASWTVGVNTATWYSPIPQPALTDDQIAAGSYYEWDEAGYQADTSDPKTVGWALTTSA